LSLVTTPVIALAGGGILAFTTIRRPSLERLGSPSSAMPVEMVKPAVASPVDRGAAQPPHIQVEGDRQARPPSASPRQGRGAVATSRDEPRDAGAVDPAAVIDWLLKTSRTPSR
jgi:hypothetical protein